MKQIVLFAFAAIGVGCLTFNLTAFMTLRYENKKMPWYAGLFGAFLFIMSVFYLATGGLMDGKRMKIVNKQFREKMEKVRYLASLSAFPTVNDCEKMGFAAPTKEQVHEKLFEQWRAEEYRKLGLDQED